MDEPEGVGRVEIRIYGMVQGVFFRHHTRLQAVKLGISGTVENLPDGSVRVVAEGARSDLQTLLAWLHDGPELAHVERVDVRWEESHGDHSDFHVLR